MVNTYISDAYDLFSTPTIATSKKVDLSNPRGASIAVETYAAVLARHRRRPCQENSCVTAITVLSVASNWRMWSRLTSLACAKTARRAFPTQV